MSFQYFESSQVSLGALYFVNICITDIKHARTFFVNIFGEGKTHGYYTCFPNLGRRPALTMGIVCIVFSLPIDIVVGNYNCARAFVKRSREVVGFVGGTEFF